jgi:GNAT superfamily N-acetyltransferase
VAGAADLDLVTGIITSAFLDDPVWSWAIPDPRSDPAGYSAYWRLFVAGSLRYPWTWVTAGGEAASVWIPPGGTDLSEEGEEELHRFLPELVGDRHATEVRELSRRFGKAHPHDEPHYYLSLLGTHADHRGKGFGMALLAENLVQVDAEHLPAYLESTNPGNNDRYRRLGFEPVGQFEVPGTGHPIATMWRPAR